jgi:putative resolvase
LTVSVFCGPRRIKYSNLLSHKHTQPRSHRLILYARLCLTTDDMGLLRPAEASRLCGVSVNTLRKWDREGKIQTVRSQGHHRRYHEHEIMQQKNNAATKRCIAYCRVSSTKQKDDLQRQVDSFKQTHPNHEVITDIGSGLNFKRKNLLRMVDAVLQGHVSEIVIAHRDRLCRFAYDLLQWVCDRSETRLIVQQQDIMSREQELSEDLMAIVHVFSCRHHGMRRYKSSKDQTQTLATTGTDTENVDEIC